MSVKDRCRRFAAAAGLALAVGSGLAVAAAAGPAAEPAAAASPGAADPGLSGTWRLRVVQRTKSCGPPLDPFDVEVPITFTRAAAEARLDAAFLGLRNLRARFDPADGTLRANLENRVSLGPTRALLKLEIEGAVRDSEAGAVIDLTFRFRKTAEDAAWNCEVAGLARATRIPPG